MKNTPSAGMPDVFDRLLGSLDGLLDVVRTNPPTIRSLTPLLGSAETYIIQTYRQKDVGDTIFIEAIHTGGSLRIVLPPKVAEVLARQRDTLTSKSRRKAAQTIAQECKNQGQAPAFPKKRT